MNLKKLRYKLVCTLAFLMMISVSHALGQHKAETTKISINKEAATLVQIFSEISKNTEINFSYGQFIIKNTKKYKAVYRDQTVTSILQELGKKAAFKYLVRGNDIVITAAPAPEPAPGNAEKSQNLMVRGTVTDPDGNPMPGVNIVEKGTTNGEISDFDGNYAIGIQNADAVLVFSYLGYQMQEIEVNGQYEISVQLRPDTSELNEVVVVGYGLKKKVNLTGAVATIEGDDISKRPVMRSSSALQGLAPGITVTQSSGRPGYDDGSIRIRGIGTLGNSNPLVLIDGVEGSLDGVNPNDIENISVLKDAASASIYGSRAANGVILVTTRTGKNEKISVTYRTYTGWQQFTDLPDYADGYTYMTKLNEAYNNMGRTPLYSEEYLADYLANKSTDPDHYPDVDWQDLIYKNAAAVKSHYLSFSGGNKVKLMSSLGYQDQEGVIPGHHSERFSYRLNASMNVLKNLQASVFLSARRSVVNSPGNSPGGIIHLVNRVAPIYAAQLSDDRYGVGINGQNPMAIIEKGGFDKRVYNNFKSTFLFNYQPVEGADIEFNFTPNYDTSTGKNFIRTIETYEADSEEPAFTVPVNSTLAQSSSNTLEITMRLLGRYNRTIGDHHLGFLAGFEQIESKYESFNASREGFQFPEYTELDAGSIELMKNSGSSSEWALRSYFGRINYDYKGKYLLEANIRRDGSSRFARGHKWGVFPSFSLGWRVSEENFLKDIRWLSNLKLRGSWGELGNQLIGNYPFASVISLDTPYVFDGIPANGAAQMEMANSLISWETTASYDLGLDFGVFGNRLNLEFDYFVRNTSDILLNLPVPTIIGLASPVQNAGKVKNTGWEIALNYRNNERAFKYQVGLNLSDVKNEVTDLKGAGPFISTYTINEEGSPINALYGYRSSGLFQTSEEVENAPEQFGNYGPGDIKYEDLNDDGVINADDKTVLGSSIPRYTYGLNVGMEFKNFDLGFLIQGVGKSDVLLRRDAAWAFYNGGKIASWQLDSWTPENTGASYPRLIADRSHNNFEDSGFWVYNGAYARLKNITLGYTFSEDITRHLPVAINSFRVYLTGDNLWAMHHLSDGWDPERPNGDATTYPITKTFVMGLNITF
ncbi:SusC/RagA family TonB-linked outer membrane protein [Sinomicrobium soli]|uniref:SusC/RagA family TonB-linked outer membrane protein n=1 Tax=Sinomicrobium sp. N-1-3-6 TaxID=2219864 RepID=UPI000DCB9C7E|nr:TonB-dependent receptor [Sinomicrobium sp. N-1-3-6]RAV30461.1 hypothetical protein DN748_02855 [Sinomicrobium sp. N-1-3-6]